MTDRTGDRILYLLKSRGALNASALAADLAITATATRQHLVILSSNGLIAADINPSRRGRPGQVWRLTNAGHARFPERHADLTLDLIHATKAVFGANGLDRLIAHREKQALDAYRAAISPRDPIEQRLVRLAELRSREGYMAAWTKEPAGFLFVENHCPICAAATACQGFCRSELAIFRTVLGPDVKIERTDHILAGARRCAYRITPA